MTTGAKGWMIGVAAGALIWALLWVLIVAGCAG
jgi:hypothetical protein